VTAVASLVVPWTLYLAVPGGTLARPRSPLRCYGKALWPVLLGAVLAMALWRWSRWLPRIPEGDVVVALDGAAQVAVCVGQDAGNEWTAPFVSGQRHGVAFLILTIALGAALFAR